MLSNNSVQTIIRNLKARQAFSNEGDDLGDFYKLMNNSVWHNSQIKPCAYELVLIRLNNNSITTGYWTGKKWWDNQSKCDDYTVTSWCTAPEQQGEYIY